MKPKKSERVNWRAIWVVRLASWTRSKLDSFADLRDLLLIVAGGMYVLGYVVWAYNAYANNLGLLPAVDFQYFIAGIVPAVFLLALSVTITVILISRREFADWINASTRRGKYMGRLFIILFILVFLTFIVAGVDSIKSAHPALSNKAIVVAAIIFVLLIIFIPADKIDPLRRDNAAVEPFGHDMRSDAGGATDNLKPRPKSVTYTLWQSFTDHLFHLHSIFLNSIPIIYIFMLALLLTIAGLSFFVTKLYPRIPQEFGGGQPRCANLDLKRAEVSDVIQQAILPQPAPNADSLIARSVRLDVHFSDGNVMLVKPHDDPDTFRSRTFEIKKGAIQSVVWCE